MTRSISRVMVALVLFLAVPAFGEGSRSDPDTYRALNLFGEVFERVRADYVEPVTDEKLIESAINGMLTALDPHSSYMDEKAYKEMQVTTQGEFGGLGIEITQENGLIKVISPLDDTPAAHAGIKPGDLILRIDEGLVTEMSLQEAVDHMRGPVDSKVRLTIRREGREPFDLTLTRAEIHIQSVKSRLEGNVGYIRITNFSEHTGTGVADAIRTLKDQAGGKLIGIVLDLRNNPGGLLDQAVAVSGDFINGGEIVSTRGRRSDDVQRYNARSDGDLVKGLPMVVLINGGSASASEIVAGALQDHHRGVLLGTRSFGKGSVQTVIPLAGHGAMRLTTARYYTPSGRSIQAKGIEPDIVVEPAKIEKLEQGQLLHEADLRGALKNTDKGAAAPAANPASRNVPPGTTPSESEKKGETTVVDQNVLGTADDYQFVRAVDLLKGIGLFNAKGGEAAGGR
jgi:carboxyl-terminal processing protease